MEFDFKSLNHEVCVHVDTEKKTRHLLKYIRDHGGNCVRNIDSFIADGWKQSDMQSETCIRVGNRGYLGYCYLGYYRSYRYEIVEFDDYDWEGFQSKGLDVSDIEAFLSVFSEVL